NTVTKLVGSKLFSSLIVKTKILLLFFNQIDSDIAVDREGAPISPPHKFQKNPNYVVEIDHLEHKKIEPKVAEKKETTATNGVKSLFARGLITLVNKVRIYTKLQITSIPEYIIAGGLSAALVMAPVKSVITNSRTGAALLRDGPGSTAYFGAYELTKDLTTRH
ncbi:10671_t:CDS:2, partial [Dentiscutata heterogama]